MFTLPLLSITKLSKRFGGTQALDGVDLEIESGEIHALLGENGAGKSTLIKILAGVYLADSGDIRLKGSIVHPHRQAVPIAFIHQDLGLVETMTVAENIALVAGYAKKNAMISWRATRDVAASALRDLGSTINPEAKIADLPLAERSLVAIARALATQADVVVLDEPTAALPEPDVARLLKVLEQLASRGIAVIYVSHRIDEVFRVAHRVTVLRDGRRVGTGRVQDTSPAELIKMIVGRSLSDLFVEPSAPTSKLVLNVDNLRTGHVGPISFRLHEGEVLGLAGLRGAGHLSVGRAIYGMLPRDSGQVAVSGETLGATRPSDAIRAGIGLLPNKRREEGLANSMSVKENTFINPAAYGVRWFQFIGHDSERANCEELLVRLSVRPAAPDLTISALSGGNQQKVILARWFAIGTPILILEEPTLGVDVGAKVDVYRLIDEALRKGHAVLLVSSDFEEVASACHRVLIFDRGHVVAELGRSDLSVARITAMASGSDKVGNEGGQFELAQV
jgi:ribose transport system ATP-binding protein